MSRPIRSLIVICLHAVTGASLSVAQETPPTPPPIVPSVPSAAPAPAEPLPAPREPVPEPDSLILTDNVQPAPKIKPPPQAVRVSLNGEEVEEELAPAIDGEEEEISGPEFVVPAPYGSGFQLLSSGTNLSRKREFSQSLQLGLGYDDNLFQARTNPLPTLDGSPTEEREASPFGYAGYDAQLTFGSDRRAYTADFSIRGDYYTERPSDPNEFNSTLAFSYVEHLSSRLQFTASADLAYLSQPDLSRPNTPSQAVGDFFNGFARADLSYDWTHHFSTVSSLSYNTTQYPQADLAPGAYDEWLLGTSAKYRILRQLSLVAEARYGISTYPDQPSRDADTIYLLAGFERTGRRLGVSLRGGVSLRELNDPNAIDPSRTVASQTEELPDEAEEPATPPADDSELDEDTANPHAEVAVSWKFNTRTQMAWTTSYGSEQTSNGPSKDPMLRTSLTASHRFTHRLQGNLSLSALRSGGDEGLQGRTFTDERVVNGRIIPGTGLVVNEPAPAARPDSQDSEKIDEWQFQVRLGLQYQLTRRCSLNASYNLTDLVSSVPENEYYRNRVELGLAYSF